MYIMTTEKNEADEVKQVFITSPRFDIDEVRRVKALIRFKLKDVKVLEADKDMEVHDIHTMMKFGRCISMSTVNGALYEMRMRVAGKEDDSMYIIRPKYVEGDIYLTIVKAYKIDKNTVNI